MEQICDKISSKAAKQIEFFYMKSKADEKKPIFYVEFSGASCLLNK